METRINAARPVDELSQLNDPGEAFKNPVQIEFIRQFVRLIRVALSKLVNRDQATPHIHLSSRSGAVWKVTVDDAGVITAEYVRG